MAAAAFLASLAAVGGAVVAWAVELGIAGHLGLQLVPLVR